MEFWISSVKVLSIIAAGLFGALALLTKYKNDETGKITKWGKFALGGIVFTALLSLTLQLLETSKEAEKREEEANKAALEARKAEESAKATAKRLEDILVTAQKTSEQQEKSLNDSNLLKSDLQKALDQQRQNLSQTEIVRGKMDESLKAQSNNTLGILRTIWDESNRVEAGHITVSVTYDFMRETRKTPPALLETAETLTLRALPETKTRLPFPPNRWSSRHLLGDQGLFLKAREQKVTKKEHRTVDGISYSQTSYFSGFDGNMRGFSDMTLWNGAIIEVLLTKQDPLLVPQLRESLDWNNEPRSVRFEKESFRRSYDITENLEEDDYYITPLPVHAKLVIYVRERPIATSEAILAKVWEHDEDVRNLIVAKFKLATVKNNAFPAFKPTLSADSGLMP
jgi:hypothetical protein